MPFYKLRRSDSTITKSKPNTPGKDWVLQDIVFDRRPIAKLWVHKNVSEATVKASVMVWIMVSGIGY